MIITFTKLHNIDIAEWKKVQVGNDQENAQSERNFHFKIRGEKELRNISSAE